jgi:hypothetical protein
MWWKLGFELARIVGHGFTACVKMQIVEQEASGHDFSRAVRATKQMLGFSP